MSDTSIADLPRALRVERTHRRVMGGIVLAGAVNLTIVVFSQPRSGLAQTLRVGGARGAR